MSRSVKHSNSASTSTSPSIGNRGPERKAVLLSVQDSARRAEYAQRLTESGFTVIEAADGLTCMQHLRTNRFALLVVDINLPWGQGDGVIDVMSQDNTIETIPTVLLGFLQVSPSDYAQVHPATPLSSDELVRVVEQRLAGVQ